MTLTLLITRLLRRGCAQWLTAGLAARAAKAAAGRAAAERRAARGFARVNSEYWWGVTSCRSMRNGDTVTARAGTSPSSRRPRR